MNTFICAAEEPSVLERVNLLLLMSHSSVRLHHRKSPLPLREPLFQQSLFSSHVVLVIDAPERGDGGGQVSGQQFGRLSVVLGFSPQQCDDMLEGA